MPNLPSTILLGFLISIMVLSVSGLRSHIMATTATTARTSSTSTTRNTRVIASGLQAFSEDNSDIIIPRNPLESKANSIRSFARFVSAGLALSTASIVLTSNSKPAYAASSTEAANAKLSSYDLPPVLFVPPGFSVLVSEYGRGNYRANLAEKKTIPVLVQFAYPQLWVVATTTVNNNGEAGTISANDYIKGDSAFYFTSEMLPGESISDAANSKAIIRRHILKSLSQKGDPTESLSIGDIREGQTGANGQKYTIVNFSYELNTEAGFLVSRRAAMSIAEIGNTLHSVSAVTTQKRFKALGDSLRDIANSFRVYKLNAGVFSFDS